MGEFYNLYVVLTRPADATTAITTAHRTILAAGGEIDGDCTFLLESDDDDDEPQPITDVEKVLDDVARNPRLGLVEYFFEGASLTVTYLNEQPGSHVDCIRCSLPQRAFERGGEELRRAVEGLAAQLHAALRAARTLMDWGLQARGFSWHDELARLRAGQVVGTYPIVDITANEG